MKIAIVKLSALGDIVHAMVVLQFIKKYNQAIEIDWIVEEDYKELLYSHPDINKVVVINLRKAKKKKSIFLLINELKKARKLRHYDLVIDMQGLVKTAMVSWLIPSTLTIGFDRASAREGIASFFYNKTFNCDYSKNIIERNFELMAIALESSANKREIKDKLPFLYASKKYTYAKLSKSKKNIILIPGASHKSKYYSTKNLNKLTTLIDANFLIIWGDSNEKIMAEEIKTQTLNVNVCEKLSIDSLKSLISQVDLVIGPDSGPTHMAWGLNVPSITLFGATPGYRNTYLTKINRIIESKSKVNPFKIDKNDFSITNIEVTDIVKMADYLLKL